MAKITGSHSIIYTQDAEADRKFFKDILKFANVDVGEGWLIFGLPPSEMAFHPHEQNDQHELYLMTDNIASFVDEMSRLNIRCSEPMNQGWGIMTSLTLPGGGSLGIYEPRHARPATKSSSPKKKAAAKSKTKSKVKAKGKAKASKKVARKKTAKRK